MTPRSPNSPEFSAADELMMTLGKAFDEAGVQYAVIGGQAVIQHGYPRTTTDVDFTLAASLSRHQTVLDMLRANGLTPRYPQDSEMIRQRQLFVADHAALGIEADFSFMDSPYLDLSLARCVRHMIEGYPVKFLGLEDLIIQKVIAGRLQDQADVVELLLVNPQADVQEIRRWLTEFEPLVEAPLCGLFEHLLHQSNS